MKKSFYRFHNTDHHKYVLSCEPTGVSSIKFCDREQVTSGPPEPLVGIRKYHSIWINKHGELRGQVLSCDKCIVSQRCADCDSGQMAAEKEKEKFECNIYLGSFPLKGGPRDTKTVYTKNKNIT